jgi:hypothetical protein
MDPSFVETCTLAFDEMLVPIVAIGGGLIVAVVWIVFGVLQSIMVNRSREQTKREIAAYVAEGSMDPQTAIELAKAGTKPSEDED